MELKKLDSLTSLRFFVAVMIVIRHSAAVFSFNILNLSYEQTVAFFFIMSGFILTYVYPSFNSKYDIKRFFTARFARVWPLHFFGFLLVIATLPKVAWTSVPDVHAWPRALTNLLLLQAWIPRFDYFFSFDTPSWSISTDFFFYLSFPFLIARFRQTWLKKLIFSLLLLFAMFFVCRLFHLADVAHTGHNQISIDGLIYVNPLSRIIEFVLGMCTALLFMNLKQHHYQYPTLYYTAFEILFFLCVFGCLYFTRVLISQHTFYEVFGLTGILWFNNSAIAPFAAAFIFIMAMGKGIISQTLSKKIFVRLGDISFALYIVHAVVLQWFLPILSKFHFFSSHILYVFYWLIILAGSYLASVFIEQPARKFILQSRYKVIKTYPVVSSS
jgi:peptidoglycan/LPS O-acetylase OafA/YrhL